MFDREIYNRNVNFLCEEFGLSIMQLAEILGAENASFINNYEDNNINPSVEELNIVADFFGVKIDWLTGRTGYVFDEDIIQKLEQKIINYEENMKYDKIEYLGQYLEGVPLLLLIEISGSVDSYRKRRTKYELDERAKILFMFNFWKYIAGKIKQGLVKNDMEFAIFRTNFGLFYQNVDLIGIENVYGHVTWMIGYEMDKILNSCSNKEERKVLMKTLNEHAREIKKIEEKSKRRPNKPEKEYSKEEQCRYINGILRNRLSWSYYNELRGLKALLKAKENGVDMDVIETLCKKIDTWTQFKALMKEYNIEL